MRLTANSQVSEGFSDILHHGTLKHSTQKFEWRPAFQNSASGACSKLHPEKMVLITNTRHKTFTHYSKVWTGSTQRCGHEWTGSLARMHMVAKGSSGGSERRRFPSLDPFLNVHSPDLFSSYVHRDWHSMYLSA